MSTSDRINTPVRIPIFDGHNDTLLSLAESGRSFFCRSDEGHVDLPRAREGGLVGGFFAVWLRDPETVPPQGETLDPAQVTRRYADVATMPPMMELSYAQQAAIAAMARLFRLERDADGAARVARTVAELRECVATGCFGLVLHIEGAE
ncbi:MAG: membrane dipeptidase, partial [Chloroflexota bacterium]|nr:membrane dipeptidase [Chloroflexota bacterium]